MVFLRFALLFFVIIVFAVLVAFGIVLLCEYFSVPFNKPVIKNKVDISGRRKISYEDCIEQWFIDNQEFDASGSFIREYSRWENNCEDYLKRTKLWRKKKEREYLTIRKQVKDENIDYQMFQFVFIRNQTRYKQVNYQRYSYTVENVAEVITKSLRQMLEIDQRLKDINYETTLKKYFSKNQRGLMTNELKQKIKERDNYTCQICGKYMPDEVGLHVDHIKPISSGGKTVESNLQVLCDKCNLKKGSKV